VTAVLVATGVPVAVEGRVAAAAGEGGPSR
jgi:hypothetical protein